MSESDPAELALLSSTLRQLLKGEPTLGSLGELGFLGLLVPEDAGGMGWRVVEAAMLAAEAGRALSPLPWAGTALAAAQLARSPGYEPVVAGLLRGDLVGVVARRRDVTFDPAEGTVSGRVTAVGPASPDVLVLAADDSSASLMVQLDAPGARLGPLEDALDITREAVSITLSGVPAVELPGDDAVPLAALAALLACADSLGALAGTVDLLVGYLSHRDAFGRPIASFQAIQHRLADLTVLVAAADALVRRAARTIATGATATGVAEGHRLVRAAQAYLGPRATAALDDCIQLSGGIGFTWEWPVHRAMRRSLVNASLHPFGTDPPPDRRDAASPAAPPEPPAQAAFRARVRAVIAEHVSVEAREGHRAPVSPRQETALRQWYRTMYDEGLLGASWPPEWGGRPDHQPWQDLIVTEELIRARAPRPIDQVLLASHVLLRFGTDEQRARYLPRIRAGADIWCQLFSEPDAGSDLAGIKARATRRADGSWLLAGQKTWTTDGHWAQLGLALLRTSPSASRHEGITAFLVPMDRPGLVVRPKPTIGGAFEFNDVFLDGVELGPEQVIGEVGHGWAVAMSGLEVERFTVGGNVVLLELLLDDVVTVAHSVSAPSEVWAAISQLSSECEAAKAYITNHADRALGGTADDADAPIAKILYSETYNRIARFGTELVMRHLPVPAPAEAAARRLRDAWLWSRAMTISGGSSEIMRNIIARRRLKLPPPA